MSPDLKVSIMSYIPGDSCLSSCGCCPMCYASEHLPKPSIPTSPAPFDVVRAISNNGMPTPGFTTLDIELFSGLENLEYL